MKKIFITLCMVALGAFVANAQDPKTPLTQAQIDTLSMNAEAVAKDAYLEFPYSKVMFATRDELASQKFKYNSKYNQMSVQHTAALNAILGILSDTYVPGTNDYRITIQYGAKDVISSLQVIFFDKSIYEHILLFASDKDCNVKEISEGKGKTYAFNYGGYSFRVNFQTIVQEVSNTNTSTTTTNSKDNKKTNTYSHSNTTTHEIKYDQYTYTVYTGNEAKSEYLAKKAAKNQKREMKGKKANSSENFL